MDWKQLETKYNKKGTEPKNWNKKIIIVMIVIIFTFIIIFSSKCRDTKTGWACEFSYFNIISEGLYEQKCEMQGGRWSCYGFCLPYYTHSCDFPYDDVGKECYNSQQCKGKCIVDFEYVEKNYPGRVEYEDINCTDLCKGTCSEYPLMMCDHWFEVNNTKIEDHTGLICD